MLRQLLARAIFCGLLFICAQPLDAQAPAKVDFRRDVQPIFKTYCVGCHGPTQQMNGFRLDRRSDAMRGGT
ncbi:MAG TPA: c-type cytochrome domain-containing protein, partial [Terriglobia bacterium]|nr:c-type cytochrome domain-containing protein [Terriglobia bacterium]